MNTQSKGLAVVTGASSGIGVVYADRLARRGYDLVLVARSQEAMSDLTKRLVVQTRSKAQAVATDLTDPKHLAELEQEIVMFAEDMVDGALAGLDQGEFVTIPALPDTGQWKNYEDARQAMLPNLSRAEPAARYGIVRDPA